MKKRAPDWLGKKKGMIILPSFIGIIIHQYKDPYETNQDFPWKVRDPGFFVDRGLRWPSK